jgi:signal transduction histidine kinase
MKFVMVCLSFYLCITTFAQKTIKITDKFLSKTLAGDVTITSTDFDTLDWMKNHKWSNNESENFRVKTGKYNWLKFDVHNSCDYDRTLLLFFQNVQIERAKLFVVQNGQVVYLSPETGCTMPVSKRATNHRTISLPIVFNKESSSTVYAMVYRKEFGLTIRPTLVEPSRGIDFYWTDYCFYAAIGSSLLLIITSLFFNYFVWMKRIRFKEIIWFQVYMIISLFYIISASGIGSMYVWGLWPWFELNASIFFGALSGAAFLFFCNRVLEIKTNNRFLSKTIDAVALFYLCATLPGFFIYHTKFPGPLFGLIITLSYLMMLICLIIVMSIGVKRALFEKKTNYYWFLGIFIFLVIYTVITLCLEMGILKYDFRNQALRILFAFFPQLLITLTFLIFRFLEKLKEIQSQLVEFRKEITHDIHDEIGSELTKISLTAHLLGSKNPSLIEKLKIVSTESIAANKKLKDLIFVINPSYDRLKDIVAYFKEIVSKLNAPYDTLIEVGQPQKDIDIQPLLKSHLIYIFDESIDIIKVSQLPIHVILSVVENESIAIQYTFNELNEVQMELLKERFQKFIRKSEPLREAKFNAHSEGGLILKIDLPLTI